MTISNLPKKNLENEQKKRQNALLGPKKLNNRAKARISRDSLNGLMLEKLIAERTSGPLTHIMYDPAMVSLVDSLMLIVLVYTDSDGENSIYHSYGLPAIIGDLLDATSSFSVQSVVRPLCATRVGRRLVRNHVQVVARFEELLKEVQAEEQEEDESI